MRLDLPSRIPLPDDVRRRALDRVLDGIEEPAPRRTWFPPAAAAVVVALVVSVSVAVAGSGRDPAPSLIEAGAPPVDPTQEHLARCAGAVDAQGWAGLYPPTAQWRVTAIYPLAGTDTVLVVDDAFACLLTPVSVALSPPEATPIGEAGVVRMAPAVLAVLNPQRRFVAFEGDVEGVAGAPDAPVSLVLLEGVEVPPLQAVVEGSFDGALPDPVAALTADDRLLPTRDYATDMEIDLDVCLTQVSSSGNNRKEVWTPEAGFYDESPPAQVARIGTFWVGLCTFYEDGPHFESAPRPEVSSREAGVLLVSDPGADGVPDRIVVAVPPSAVRVEVTAGGSGAVCPIESDLALCVVPLTGEDVEVRTFDAAGVGTPVPLP